MKKRLLSCILVLCLTLAMMPLSVSAATPDTNWYYSNPDADTFYIGTADELAGLADLSNNGKITFEGKTIYLTNDIDLSGYANNWTSIGYYSSCTFRGTFDGNFHTISNFTSSNSLFSYVYGTVRNLGMLNVYVTGSSSAGIARQVYSSGLVENCLVTGVLSSSNAGGGIAILVQDNAIVRNCYALTTISGTGNVGGIAATLMGRGTVTNCFALNDYINGRTTGNNGRVVGGATGSNYTLSNNMAFEGMSGNSLFTESDPNGRGGQDISAKAINAPGFFGNWNIAIPDYLLPGYDCAVDGHAFDEADYGSYLLYTCQICGYEELAYLTEAFANINGIVEAPKGTWQVTFTVTRVFDNGVTMLTEHTVDVGKNGDGMIDLGIYTLIYDIKGNGSNIKRFEIVMK